jgi:hypothetical protein
MELGSTPKTFIFFAMYCIKKFTPIFLWEDFGGMLEIIFLGFKFEGE